MDRKRKLADQKKEPLYRNICDFKVESTLYDILLQDTENRTNMLHLFDLDTVDDSLVKEGLP